MEDLQENNKIQLVFLYSSQQDDPNLKILRENYKIVNHRTTFTVRYLVLMKATRLILSLYLKRVFTYGGNVMSHIYKSTTLNWRAENQDILSAR